MLEKNYASRELIFVAFLMFILLLTQSRAEYVGGTASTLASGNTGSIDVSDQRYLAFYTKRGQVRVSYDRVNLLEYGQKVDRRYVAAVLLSPLFLMAKKRSHFLTVGYSDEENRQQAMVFRVGKDDIRMMLVSLEARTGRKVEFQDDDARKSGKG
jgi:hypothetical protein